MRTWIIAAAAVAGFTACTSGSQPVSTELSLDTDEHKTLYALGVALGSNIEEFDLTPAELAYVSAGMSDVIGGEPYRVDMEVYGARIQGLANERMAATAAVEKEASMAFAEEMAKEPGAERFDSGLILIPEVEGTGDSPGPTDTVRVHYHGTLRDGTVFDSSVDRGEPISFPLNGVIACWTEGLQKMKVGGKAKLICPSEIAYGPNGTGPIPGGATLAFDVELLGIEAPEADE